MGFDEALELTAMSLRAYAATHRHWCIAYSGGKDSSATVTAVVHLILTGRVPAPESLTILYADTRMELPPLQAAALDWLKKAHKMKPNAEALEMIGLIEHKRGQYAQAAKDFEAAAALPRETPLEKRVDEARLLRLAAESRAASGDSPSLYA